MRPLQNFASCDFHKTCVGGSGKSPLLGPAFWMVRALTDFLLRAPEVLVGPPGRPKGQRPNRPAQAPRLPYFYFYFFIYYLFFYFFFCLAALSPWEKLCCWQDPWPPEL